MRKLFFIVCCILALDICLAEEWWKDNFIIGAHWGPSLHHKNNDVDSPLVRNFNLLKDGGFNFILGQMNTHNSQAFSFMYHHVDSLSEECRDSGLYFLNEAKDPNIYCGINLADEPSKDKVHGLLEKVDSLKNIYPDKLSFINLLPSHSSDFSTFNDWKGYVNAYLGSDTLQIACFDNYNPHSQFSTHKPDSNMNYYSNLAYMKQVAGSRPLWAYLRSSEKSLEEEELTWQDAYIRLGAFAPLAFGAKGIIYFCYDCKDRNMILRSPGRGSWGKHDIYFDNDEKSRQIFFGNIKDSTTSVYPDLAIHTNDNQGTWRIKETSYTGVELDQNLFVIGTWYGDHYHNMPNIYNWDFTPDGYDKFTTITSHGDLLLSRFRSGWIKKAIIDNFPTPYWSTMSRYTCPFGDFNDNQALDLCLGWKESGRGKLRICMDCQNIPTTPQGANMAFANTSQIFTFCDPIKQVIASLDSTLYVITSKSSGNYVNSDSIYILKYSGNQFNAVDTSLITLQNKIDHYWMEDSLYAQDINGKVWVEAPGQTYSLTKYIKDFSTNLFSIWGQYNNRTNKYDRYGLAADGKNSYQSYALLNRKGNPNEIYYTAQAINRFINDNISTIIMEENWLGACFSSPPNQSVSGSLNIIKGPGQNPFPLIYNNSYLSDNVLFGLYQEDNNNLDLLVINMQESSRSLTFTFKPGFLDNDYFCENITRMYSSENLPADSTVTLNNMLGGECAILHFTSN